MTRVCFNHSVRTRQCVVHVRTNDNSTKNSALTIWVTEPIGRRLERCSCFRVIFTSRLWWCPALRLSAGERAFLMIESKPTSQQCCLGVGECYTLPRSPKAVPFCRVPISRLSMPCSFPDRSLIVPCSYWFRKLDFLRQSTLRSGVS